MNTRKSRGEYYRDYRRVAALKTPAQFTGYLHSLGVELPFDVELADPSPLAQPYTLRSGQVIGNRFCIHPMEGWDGTPDGLPSELTQRRWTNFGRSGAKLIWGGEAVAVRQDGRANPNQLMIEEHTLPGLDGLRRNLIDAHRAHSGSLDGLLVGLQLTHSGRFARPYEKQRLEPKILYHHPLLDAQFGLPPDLPLLSDGEIDDLLGDFVRAARQAQTLGFDFVDLKHCHGYLGHEFLSAYTRPGRYGGSFENRTRFLREVVNGIRREAPGLLVGVRLSVFDSLPFRAGPDGVGKPADWSGPYPYAFGVDPDHPLEIDLREPLQLLDLLVELGIELVNCTAGTPYYNPHILRPAYFPPSDGYLPPEDPLVGVARQLNTVASLKQQRPGLALVGTGYTYLQDWLLHVAQSALRQGLVDFVGLGRMMLAYPELPADVLAGRQLQYKRLCRSFSDCTTAPRQGLVSGCYPLDARYKGMPEAPILASLRKK